jgi:hypothetical protein
VYTYVVSLTGIHSKQQSTTFLQCCVLSSPGPPDPSQSIDYVNVVVLIVMLLIMYWFGTQPVMTRSQPLISHLAHQGLVLLLIRLQWQSAACTVNCVRPITLSQWRSSPPVFLGRRPLHFSKIWVIAL